MGDVQDAEHAKRERKTGGRQAVEAANEETENELLGEDHRELFSRKQRKVVIHHEGPSAAEPQLVTRSISRKARNRAQCSEIEREQSFHQISFVLVSHNRSSPFACLAVRNSRLRLFARVAANLEL